MQIAIAAKRHEIRNCRSYNDDLGCMTGCKSQKVGRNTACPFEDGKEYVDGSRTKFQQDCPCFR